MQNTIDPNIQVLLDELSEPTSLDRKKEFARLLEPYSDRVIPIFIERLDYQGEKYDIEFNAIKMLAILADHRGILPLLRHIEKGGRWTKNVFLYIRHGLKEKDNSARQMFIKQLIRYLEFGPRVRIPKPYDRVAAEKRFNDFFSFLMKIAGVKELSEQTQK